MDAEISGNLPLKALAALILITKRGAPAKKPPYTKKTQKVHI
jgi:hypothetical protein